MSLGEFSHIKGSMEIIHSTTFSILYSSATLQIMKNCKEFLLSEHSLRMLIKTPAEETQHKNNSQCR